MYARNHYFASIKTPFFTLKLLQLCSAHIKCLFVYLHFFPFGPLKCKGQILYSLFRFNCFSCISHAVCEYTTSHSNGKCYFNSAAHVCSVYFSIKVMLSQNLELWKKKMIISLVRSVVVFIDAHQTNADHRNWLKLWFIKDYSIQSVCRMSYQVLTN